MRWFVHGDIHGQIDVIYNFIQRFNLGEGDNIIVVGDMGLCWRQDKKDYYYNIDMYEKYCNGVHLYWIDGNHENFDIISSWDLDERGLYDNSEHIHYISRGTVMNINVCGDSRSCLFMGGADSLDRKLRVEHLTWWADEQITKRDIKNVKIKNVDYIFTHSCPKSIIDNYAVYLFTLGGVDQTKIDHTSELRLEELLKKVNYKHHYFGHHHIDKQLDDKHTCVYNDFIELK